MNIPHTGIISSALDLWSGYFQMAGNPSDIVVKLRLPRKNGTLYAFRRMPFLTVREKLLNFQKAVDIILKPVIGKFVSVYGRCHYIISPSFTQHVKHLKEVFSIYYMRRGGDNVK
ncbi:hypothetical protein TNCV_2836711 [Trichonephila clavipes]|nr:hypothetical protein TNCV_2836711 [Trichonephila clavipes]